MINVGVIGLGMMGLTHLDVYRSRSDVKIVAISDINPERLSGRERTTGNIEGQAQGGFDYSSVRQYAEGMDLLADKEVEMVDICLPTPLHTEYAIKALKKGKHVMSEKPTARDSKQAAKYVKAAAKSQKFSMVAQCIRFWPGWSWLKEQIDSQTYGKVLAASFRRLAQLPPGPFYRDGQRSGGAILDLHIHDVDFVQYCFGMPQAVTSVGYVGISGKIDHVHTRYHYAGVPMVTAEGGWGFDAGFPFTMQFMAKFERATAVYDLAGKSPLMLYRDGQEPQAVPLEAKMGYELEIAYFLDCLHQNRRPSIVTVEDAAKSVKIIEAEEKSVQTGKTVKLPSAPAIGELPADNDPEPNP